MSLENPTSKPRETTIKFSKVEGYRDGYANSVQVRMSAWDFQLTFATLRQEVAEEVTLDAFQGIYLSPQQAKALWNILGHNLAQYEQTFGKLLAEQPNALPVPPTPFPQGGGGPVN